MVTLLCLLPHTEKQRVDPLSQAVGLLVQNVPGQLETCQLTKYYHSEGLVG